ncbi:hypothetical protein COT98_03340 [Candidatus Falkowbacteria bacterium CG10_big_fil_rev_8_21_14_0_10_39_9]|uniref:Glycosyltransferase RgtA/B/C/D-like domain-containing protein n=1 Tax=Candidatus Falkowbacteria bacterium CG10_big_fil_rev_8_21_14_0_10_39_9 TaxID=1974566 RepID=A0A2M6WNY8_9BACT|nr:MAG: hypothetical protein COT98_03340 [Candidatus Falkowbacteria bacterium CG10_big_fil_rev_8_21_14_0_10_39_9]
MFQSPKLKFNTIIWVLFYILIFALLLKHSYSYLDPDFGWHLKTGEEIINTGQVPHINQTDYTLAGQTWVDHEWLTNATIYWVFINWGYLAINIIFALIPLLTLILLNQFTIKEYTKEKTNIWLFILIDLMGLMAFIPHFGVRMQEITFFCTLLLSLILYYYNKNKNWKVLLWLLPLFYFWANAHGGFLIGWIILLLFWLAKVTEYLLHRFLPWKFIDFKNLLTRAQIRNYILVSLAGLTTTFLIPYGLKLYKFFGTYTNTFYFNHILEWFPQWNYPYVYWQCLYICLIISILLIDWYYIFKKDPEHKLNIWQSGIVLGFVILATKSRRHFPLLFIISAPWFLAFITNFLEIKPVSFKYFRQQSINIIIKIFLLLCLTVVPLNILLTTNFVNDPFKSFCENSYLSRKKSLLFPCQAINIIKTNPQYNQLKLFNNFSWGGFLIWIWPEKQLFIDGRLPQANYEGRSLLEEYWDFFKTNQSESLLEKHQIKMVLLYEDTNLTKLSWWEKNFLFMNEAEFNQKNTLKEYLTNSPKWKLIYADNIAAVYIKK